MRKLLFTILLAVIAVSPGCTVNYSFTGASIPPQLKTVSVQTFENRAPISYITLSQDLTDNLKDMFQRRTNLQLVNGVGDADFEGVIEQYRSQPVSVQADEQANLERLTIMIRVTYSNNADPEQDFTATFSRYEDYDARVGLDAVESELVEKIVNQLVEDVFNRAFVNW